MLTEDQLRQFGDWERASWERTAGAYAASLGDLTRGSIPALLAAARVGPGSHLLDVGSGPGFVALAAAARGSQVAAADQSAAMVAIARAAGVDAVAAGAEELPFPDGRFDAVTAGYLLNHLPHPEAAVAEFARVLEPGGRLAMTVWDTPEVNLVTGLFVPIVAELGLTAAVPPGPDGLRFAADGELRRLLSGWDDVRVERPRWSVRVQPGAWFDAIAAATPRTGAVLQQAGPSRRAAARERYVDLATRLYGDADGFVVLPAAAVLVSAARRSLTVRSSGARGRPS